VAECIDWDRSIRVNLAAGGLFAATAPTVQEVVLQPSKGLTVRVLLELFGARRIVLAPRPLVGVPLQALVGLDVQVDSLGVEDTEPVEQVVSGGVGAHRGRHVVVVLVTAWTGLSWPIRYQYSLGGRRTEARYLTLDNATLVAVTTPPYGRPPYALPGAAW
jgi:hypothetical protein